jgi:ATP-binding cassette, subfamily B (MDR/TAP), member 1
MGLENAFDKLFQAATDRALRAGIRGAVFEGCSHGVANAMIYLSEALLFYVGAVLIVKGIFTYLQMVEVLNLVVFTVTISSQLMAFSTSSPVLVDDIVSTKLLQLRKSRNLYKQLVILTSS